MEAKGEGPPEFYQVGRPQRFRRNKLNETTPESGDPGVMRI